MQEYEEKHFFPSVLSNVKNWVSESEICIKSKRMSNTPITLEFFHNPELNHGPEDFLQTDFLLELQPSGGYETIVTAVSKYAFSRPFSNSTAVNTANIEIDIMTRQPFDYTDKLHMK